jgi:hypothetical protein
VRDTEFGTFSHKLMEEPRVNGWHVISMKNDWEQTFAPEP